MSPWRVRAAVAPAQPIFNAAAANPSFATRDPAAFAALLGGAAPIDVDFWTEAALLAERGIDAVVFGPGSIEQAHAADEYVEISDLELARQTFSALLRHI